MCSPTHHHPKQVSVYAFGCGFWKLAGIHSAYARFGSLRKSRRLGACLGLDPLQHQPHTQHMQAKAAEASLAPPPSLVATKATPQPANRSNQAAFKALHPRVLLPPHFPVHSFGTPDTTDTPLISSPSHTHTTETKTTTTFPNDAYDVRPLCPGPPRRRRLPHHHVGRPR
jgi:hypothetical protein